MTDLSHLRRHKKQRVVITNNMRALLYALLTSAEFENGKFVFHPSGETQQFLDGLNSYDILDCHYRLELPNSCGPGVWEKANAYILNKVKKRLNNE